MTPPLRFWVGWRKALLRSLTNILWCIFECNKNWNESSWLWSWNLVSWTQLIECCDRTWSIKRWPFLWIPLTFTVSAEILFHVDKIEETLAFTLKWPSDQFLLPILNGEKKRCYLFRGKAMVDGKLVDVTTEDSSPFTSKPLRPALYDHLRA